MDFNNNKELPVDAVKKQIEAVRQQLHYVREQLHENLRKMQKMHK
ncbi:hypothetical protein [Mucilaginibacter ginkgonis]|nr:hypothetical protein [Mucilaginibacter ginkgonis]